jgi:hypothetical protein
MWTRYHIKCSSCDKVTNLRIQIPEKKTLAVSFNCLGCDSELKATLAVNFEKASWDFKAERGSLIEGDFNSGDFFHEFSDTLATTAPSDKPHDIVMPTLRMPTSKLEQLKDTKDKRKLHSNEEWEDFKDLARAYIRFDKPVIERLAKKIIGDLYPDKMFVYNIELDYHRNYFLTLNYLVFPWIDFDNHSNFITWLNKNIFNQSNSANSDLLDFVQNITSDDVCVKIRKDVNELIIRFVDIRENFFYANNDQNDTDGFAAVQDFTRLKNFYTDCFEFLGRTSPLIFRLQNFYERANQNTVPSGSPRNVTTAATFAALDHGQKLDILNLSSEPEPKLLYSYSFDSRLRNGINHFKAKLDTKTQTISYFPVTKRPDEEYQIKYIDFLNISLDSFNSVLKIGQLIKMVTIFKVATKNK